MKKNLKMAKMLLALLLAAVMIAGCAPGKEDVKQPEQQETVQPADPGSDGPSQPEQPVEPEKPEEPEVPEEPQEPEEPKEPEIVEPQEVVSTLVVCGDMMTHLPITEDAWNKVRGWYDFTRLMAAAGPYVAAGDCAVVNLETTLAGGPNYSGYPCFNAPDKLAYDLRDLGFDLIMTSNNHSLDKGGKGVIRTLDVLDEVGLPHIGTSRSQEEYDNNFQIMDVGGISIAFLAYTYGTNGIPTPSSAPYAVNLFNTDYLTHMSTPDKEKILADLEAAKASGADMVAVMMHWGIEYKTSPNSYQKQLTKLLTENGADLVLGGHPHVLQPIEYLDVTRADGTKDEAFVSYSLGNFISSQNYELTDTTVVLTLELTKNLTTGETRVSDYWYRPMFMLDREGGTERFELLDIYKQLEDENLSDSLRKPLEKALENIHKILGPEHDEVYRQQQAAEPPAEEQPAAGTEQAAPEAPQTPAA